MAFKPGESGNPGGLAASTIRRVGVARFANLIPRGSPKAIVERICKEAAKGDPKSPFTAVCLRLFCERVWPALQRSEETGVVQHQHQHRLEIGELSRHITRQELKQIQEAARDILKQQLDARKPEPAKPGESVH